jgi:phage recombination protein Bet
VLNVSQFASPTREASPNVSDVTKQTVLDYLAAFGLASQLTDSEKLQFIEISQAFKLNPFKREIHVAVYGEGEYRRLSIITGYEVYLKRAERTGMLDGWKAWVEGEGEQMKALVEIHRKDWSEPFVHEVYWREAVQKKKDGTLTAFWTKQPKFQLKKVAISQGFRLAFPDELGGLPYDASELPEAEALTAVSTVSAVPSAPKASEKDASLAPKASTPVTLRIPSSGPITSRPVESQPVVSPKPDPVTIRFLGYQDPYPEEPQDVLLVRLEHYLDDNYSAFTERHRDWIFEKAKHSRDRHGVLKMLSYSEKVVKNISAVAGASA